MLIGSYINGGAVVVGGLAGAFFGHRIPARVRLALPQTFGLASMGLGVVLLLKVKYMPAVVLATILGAIVGELFYVEKGIGRLALGLRGLVQKVLPANEGVSAEVFTERFVAISIIFCASGLGIFGSMHEGMTGDASVLYVKAILDFFVAVIFGASLGYAVASIALPQVLIQLTLAVCARFILPLTSPEMMADFTATGGLIMLATGFRICEIKIFPVANFLPALFLVMPLSHYWMKFVG